MVDAIGTPEFAEEFRRHQRKWWVRLRKWWFLFCVRLRLCRRPWYCMADVIIRTAKMRTATKPQVCDLCHRSIAQGTRALKTKQGWKHFECHLKAQEGE